MSVCSRPLGNTGLKVSEIGLGCASYWAKRYFPERRAGAVVEAALECGICVFDTGSSYAGGKAEWRLGRLLRAAGADPDTLLVGTKAGTVIGTNGRPAKDFSPEGVIRSVEKSLVALDMERLPLLQLHGPDPVHLSDELIRCLEDLRTSGKVRLLGINGFSPVIQRASHLETFDVLMPFYSVANPGGKEDVDMAAAAGKGVLVAGPLARMVYAPPLTWLWRPQGYWYLARALSYGLGPLLRGYRLRPALSHPGWSPAQLAMAWVLEHPGVSCAVFGTTDPDHLREVCAASGRKLPVTVQDAVSKINGLE